MLKMERTRTRTRTKTKSPDFVRCVTEFVRGKNVRHYYASFSGKLRRITKAKFDRFMTPLDARLHGRRQKHKKGAGETPGAGHCWPLKCEALAVHPKQVAQMNERNKKHGINVRYEPKYGIAIVPDEGEYRKLRKLEGVHHNNSYNG